MNLKDQRSMARLVSGSREGILSSRRSGVIYVASHILAAYTAAY